MSFIELSQVERVYQVGTNQIHALRSLSLTIERGQFVVILGPSGSGKTTLLNLVGGIDRATGGSLLVDGTELRALSRAQLGEYRKRQVGIVFQFFNLLPSLTAWENVELIADLTGSGGSVEESLRAVGLTERKDHFPHELSGGEKQRVAIARALIKSPPLLLADEPTGNLDVKTGRSILKLLQSLHSQGQSIILVTHNSSIAELGERVIVMGDGELRSDRRVKHPKDAESIEW